MNANPYHDELMRKRPEDFLFPEIGELYQEKDFGTTVLIVGTGKFGWLCLVVCQPNNISGEVVGDTFAMNRFWKNHWEKLA